MSNKLIRTKVEVAEMMIAGTSFVMRSEQEAKSQVTKLLKNRDLPVKRLAKLVKLPEFVIRKFRRIAKEYKIE